MFKLEVVASEGRGMILRVTGKERQIQINFWEEDDGNQYFSTYLNNMDGDWVKSYLAQELIGGND